MPAIRGSQSELERLVRRIQELKLEVDELRTTEGATATNVRTDVRTGLSPPGAPCCKLVAETIPPRCSRFPFRAVRCSLLSRTSNPKVAGSIPARPIENSLPAKRHFHLIRLVPTPRSTSRVDRRKRSGTAQPRPTLRSQRRHRPPGRLTVLKELRQRSELHRTCPPHRGRDRELSAAHHPQPTPPP
jgi:hypothetical protein